MTEEKTDPTNLDLHTTQARHSVLLEGLSDNITDIKDALLGKDGKDGVLIDVDRLKRSRKRSNAFLWAIFIAFTGATGTVLATFILEHLH